MIIAGAGGHGLEVRSCLIGMGFSSSDIYFFDQDKTKKESFVFSESIIIEEKELSERLKNDPRFALGVGNPESRKKLFDFFIDLGGLFVPFYGDHTVNQNEQDKSFDTLSFAFVGPQTKIGKGVLINTRANVHHECQIGEFSEIGPGAILLGNVKIGKNCRIGAGAVLLPGIEIGNNVIVGAGSVVTKNFPDQVKLIGVPANPFEIGKAE